MTTNPLLDMDVSITSRVLLLEDNQRDAEYVRQCIQASNNGAVIELEWARTLKSGLERLKAEKYAAVLLDLCLPDSTEVIQTLRAIVNFDKKLPVVVLTDVASVEVALTTLREGAQDYLVKGESDKYRVAQVILYAIERKRLEIERQELKLARHQFETAMEIQHALYPKEPPSLPSYDIAGASVSADSVGGDYYDYFLDAGGRPVFVCADASGHDIAAAMLATQVRTGVRTLSTFDSCLSELVGNLEKVISPVVPAQYFATMALVRLDPASGEFEYVCAGTEAYLLNQNGDLRATLESQIPPLNMLELSEPILSGRLTLMPGELLVLNTDGITEAGQIAQFGVNRMIESVRRNRQLSAEQIVHAVIEDARMFCGSIPQHDDMTLVIVRRRHDSADVTCRH